jgi:hypothetical protein
VGTADPEAEEEAEEPVKATHSSFIPEEVKITNASDAMIKLKKRTAPLKVQSKPAGICGLIRQGCLCMPAA